MREGEVGGHGTGHGADIGATARPWAHAPAGHCLRRVGEIEKAGASEHEPLLMADGENLAGLFREHDQRIGFVEARNGRKILRYLDPSHPRVRRDAGGQIRNSFLRTARPGDPIDTPLLAGQMLCAVARPFG